MDVARHVGSEAFQWLDQNLVESLEAPDEAFDWVFMLRDSDWPLLETVWDQRSAQWREALAYVLNDGPVQPAQRLLVRALFDENSNVASEAAATLAHHLEIAGDAITLTPEVLLRIRQILPEHT